MKSLAGVCTEITLTGNQGAGAALQVELESAGDEPTPIAGCALSRQGINLFPEFAAGFNFDTSKMIAGLPPDRYQFRVTMLLLHAGRLIYGDGKSEFLLRPGRKAPFVIPVPFQAIEYFLSAPPEDVFFTVSSLSGPPTAVTVPGLHELLVGIVGRGPRVGTRFNTQYELLVPLSAPPAEADLSKAGTFNPKPIRPLPNN
ncbi:MAG: hypothetical protein JNL96_24730 [Planctomycetaceae bacterium]|nr:hypothetical protein [Planctomycetaceae bacterium]